VARLLVLGAGYIGAKVAELALEQGDEVVLADNWYATRRGQLAPLEAVGARVETADGRTVPRDALFVPPRLVPHDELLVSLGCDRDEGAVVLLVQPLNEPVPRDLPACSGRQVDHVVGRLAP
jgi:nucleoside-diphosphate-sugar epimerase